MTSPDTVVAPNTPEPDAELVALSETWAPAWSIWRAHRSEDPPGINRGEFVASRMEEMAGRWPTVMCSTAAEMDAALRHQRDTAGLSPLAVVPYAVGS